MAVRDAMQEVQEARLAYAAKRYTQAEEHYRNALAVMPDVPAAQRQRAFISESLADALIARAIDYRAVGRHEEATQFLQEAVRLDPKSRRAKAELAYTGDPVRTNPALSPQHVGNVAEVNRLLELAHGYIDLGLYDDANKTFRSVLQIDSHNTAARKGMEAVEKHRSSYYATARDAHRAKMMAQVDAEWEEPVPADELSPTDESTAGASSELTDDSLKQSYAERLSEMVLPGIVFDDVRITDVIEALQNQISRFEASGNTVGGRHINLTANFGSPDSPAYKQLTEQSINMTLTDVSVKDILDMLEKRLGIRYFYTPVGVELCLGDRDSGPLLDRTFRVPPHFFDPRSDSDDEDDEDGGFAAEKVSVSRVNPVQVLKGMGITFPKGAVAVYSPSTRSLRVRNTAQNLEDIEAALDMPMDRDSQIILSVIAMEVFENDLNQLGFEWLLNVSLGSNGVPMLSGGKSRNALSTATGTPLISTELGTNNNPYMSSGLRGVGVLKASDSMESLIESGSTSAHNIGVGAKSPSIFGIRGVWSVADVTFIMNGLSQKKGVDILQNPKLVFSPGVEEQVSVGSVDEMFFPETWEQGEVSSSNNNSNNGKYSYSPLASGANPADFVRLGCTDDAVDGLGTILLVHKAELEETAQGTFVNLALTTVIKEFEGFINWGSPINSAIISKSDIAYIELTPNYILQPMIKRYVENTQIKVAPGTVIVMGGLKEAKNIEFEDKIPVLGDLPLVGRLFRSSGERKQRKALIFFVKVDYVDPTGKNPTTGERPSQEM